MNDLAKKWVAALRSGEYKQAKKSLRTDEGYCCLGVACEIAVKAGLPVTVHFIDKKGFCSYDGGVGVLPEGVMHALRFKSVDGYTEKLQKSLTTLNDIENLTFAEIADYIETNEAELFFPDINENTISD